jgi:hypothetical protein
MSPLSIKIVAISAIDKEESLLSSIAEICNFKNDSIIAPISSFAYTNENAPHIFHISLTYINDKSFIENWSNDYIKYKLTELLSYSDPNIPLLCTCFGNPTDESKKYLKELKCDIKNISTGYILKNSNFQKEATI